MSDEKKPMTRGVKAVVALAVLGFLGAAGVLGYHFVLPRFVERRVYYNSVAARSDLVVLADAQSRYHELMSAKGTPTYGTLADLAREKLVDDVLATGTKNRYVFEVQPSKATGEERGFLWWATARPATPEAGEVVLFINQAGVVYTCKTDDVASNLRPDPKTCAPLPAGSRPPAGELS